MPGDIRVKLVLDTKDAEGSLKSFGKTGATSLITLNQALEVARKAVRAMKDSYNFAREGAELDQLRTRWGNLSAEMGLGADFLVRMKEETHGLMSETELMTSAMEALQLRLVTNQGDLERLIKTTSELGFDTNELVLALANQSKRRLDQLGLDLQGFNKNLAEAQAQGLDDQAAFTEAFFKTAEVQVQRMGSVADTALGDFKRLEAGWATMTDRVKADVAADSVGLVGWLADVMDNTNRLSAAVEFLNPQIESMAHGIYTLADGSRLTNMQLIEYAENVRQSTDAAESFDRAIIGADTAMDSLADSASSASASTETLGGAIEDLNLGLETFIENQLDLAVWAAGGGAELQSVVQEIMAEYEAGNINLGEMRGLLEWSQIEALKLKVNLGLIDWDAAQEQARELGLDLGTPAKHASDIRSDLAALRDKTVTITVNRVERTSHERAREFGGPTGPGIYRIGEAGEEGLIVHGGLVEVIPHGKWVTRSDRHGLAGFQGGGTPNPAGAPSSGGSGVPGSPISPGAPPPILDSGSPYHRIFKEKGPRAISWEGIPPIMAETADMVAIAAAAAVQELATPLVRQNMQTVQQNMRNGELLAEIADLIRRQADEEGLRSALNDARVSTGF